MSSGLNIAALARRTGVAPDTLRKWEQRYGILRPTRTDGGQRRYSEHDVDRVVWLKARLAEGYRIGEAANLLGVESDATAKTAAELAALVLAAARRSDGAAVNRLLDHAFSTDLDAASADVVMPLLVAVGESWHAGGITIAQEHLVTSAVRARLERRLAEVRAAVHGRAVLACAPGERHELGLLMLAVRLRADGWDVTYLGQDMPVADTLAMAVEMGATLVCFSIGTADAAAALEDGLRDATRPRGLTVVVGGRAANPVIAARVDAVHASGPLGELVASLRAAQPTQLAG
jgi:DNA-binding transcriptional MerR regulator